MGVWNEKSERDLLFSVIMTTTTTSAPDWKLISSKMASGDFSAEACRYVFFDLIR
jgi:hypothetical protein